MLDLPAINCSELYILWDMDTTLTSLLLISLYATNPVLVSDLYQVDIKETRADSQEGHKI